MANQTLRQSGVYCITHIPSGLIYIGSSVNIHRRWNDHKRRLRLGTHTAKRMQVVWNIDGASAFDVYTIEHLSSRLELFLREQHWLDRLDPCCPTIGFNVSDSAAGGCCSGPLSAEMRAKLSAVLSGTTKSETHREKIAAAHTGKVRSDEAREAMAQAQRRRFAKAEAKTYLLGKRSPETCAKISAKASIRPPPSAETRAKISAANRGRKFAPGLYETRRLGWLGRKHTPAAIIRMRTAAQAREATRRASKQ